MSDVSPTNLSVDYEREPTNIEVAPKRPPQFRWSLDGDGRRVKQTSYRVRIATDSSELTSEEETTVWDTGRLHSSEQQIVYDGEPFEGDKTYYWAVRVWDGDGRPSEWSNPAQFTTTISSSEWSAEWIRAPDIEEERSPPSIEDGMWIWCPDDCSETQYFRRTIEVDGDRSIESACILVAAANRARLWVNGKSVWRTLNWDEPHLTGCAEVFEVTQLLSPGENQLAVAAIGPGDEAQDAEPGFLLRLHLGFEDGSVQTFDTDDEWVVTRGSEEWASPGDLEWKTTHADAEMWTDPDFDDADWDFAVERDLRPERDITVPDSVAPPPAPLLRTEQTFDRSIRRAHVHVAAAGIYEMFINGERVGDQVLDPGQTDYDETVLFSTHDVTDSLREGTNAVGLALGRERFGECAPNVWNWHRAPWWNDPAATLCLKVEFVDGSTETVVSNSDWKTRDGPTRFDSFYAGELYDARHERDGWTKPGYDDENWNTAAIADGPSGTLRPQRIRPMEVVNEITPVERTCPKSETYVFDVGRIVNGIPQLTVSGPAGTHVRLQAAERLGDDGTVDIENRHISPPMQTDTYILRGDGTEVWQPRFGYRGFRYLQVEGYPGKPNLDDITACIVRNPVDQGDESGFACSNELLNRIHGNARRALLNNFVSIQTGSNYEKNGWTGDALATAETGLYNFDLSRFYRKWLNDFADAQRDSGELPCIIPTSDWGYGDIGGITAPNPGWDSLYVYLAWWLYQYCGDEQVLAQHFDGMCEYVDYLGGYAEDGLVDVGLGDWLPPGHGGDSHVPPEGPAITSTALYADCARVLADAADVLEFADVAATYHSLHTDVRDTLNTEFFDESTGVYSTGESETYRQTSNIFPIAFGLVPDEHTDTVVENLVQDVVETHSYHLDTGFQGTRLILPVLSEHGYHDVAYAVATQTDYPSWGNWITSGMSSLLEAWTLDSRSRDHHFFGSIDQWFYQYVAGIRGPAAPGFNHVDIAPLPAGNLTWASADVDTVRGAIRSHWGITEETEGVPNTFSLDVGIPENTTATIRMPTFGVDDPVLWEGQVPIHAGSTSAGIDNVSWGDDTVDIEVGSGTYRFRVEH